VITDPNDVSGLRNIGKERPERRVNELDRSLGDYRGYNRSIGSYYFYLDNISKSIVLSSRPCYFVYYSKIFDRLKRELCM